MLSMVLAFVRIFDTTTNRYEDEIQLPDGKD